MKAFIYVGGEIFTDGITEQKKGDDIVISADRGYLNAIKLGVTVNFAVGDFDSMDKCKIEGAEIIEVPAEKDFTDTALAVDLAIEKGADQITIIGGLGGRLDHTLSNIGILERLWDLGIRATITDGKNRIRYIKNTSELVARANFKYISVLSADGIAKGVCIEGCKYPLKNARLTRSNGYAVSNEILKNCALVSVKKGGLYIIESRD